MVCLKYVVQEFDNVYILHMHINKWTLASSCVHMQENWNELVLLGLMSKTILVVHMGSCSNLICISICKNWWLEEEVKNMVPFLALQRGCHFEGRKHCKFLNDTGYHNSVYVTFR